MGLSDYLNQNETNLIKVEEGQLIIAQQMEQALLMLDSQKKRLAQEEKEMKEKLEKIMRQNNISGYESSNKKIRISLGEDTTNYDIDKDMLWEKYPNIYRECNVKEIKRKGTLRITIRDKEE